MLSSEEKAYLVKKAEKYFSDNRGYKESFTQIQKFSSIAQQSDCLEEFQNFIKYQTGRERDRTVQNFRKGLLDEIEEIEEKVGYEKSLEAIAMYFGYMVRFAKFKRS